MATRILTINFTPCEPAPEGGYNVQYRLLGSEGPYIDAGNFFGSPAVVVIEDADECDQYEGFIRSVCALGMFGAEIPFETQPCVPPPPVITGIAINGDKSVTVLLQSVGNYDVKIVAEPDCNAVAVDSFTIDNNDEGTSVPLANGTYYACVRSICEGCEFSDYVLSNQFVIQDDPPPGITSGEFDLANDDTAICSSPVGAQLWYFPPWGSGTIMYQDINGTIPQTGFTYIKVGSTFEYYALNPTTGEVGTPLGVCP